MLYVPAGGDHKGNGTTGVSVFPFGPATDRHTSTGTQVYHLCSSSVISVSFLFFKTCSESVRARAAKSAWLGDLFLPNITLFMDRRYFSDSEWNRLEHFVPPFGFMDLNYSRESLRACQDGTFRLPTGTWRFAASPHQRHQSRRISWWKLWWLHCVHPKALDNSPLCLLHSGEGGHIPAAPKAPPAAAPGQP